MAEERASFFEGRFDYQSLLPSGSGRNSNDVSSNELDEENGCTCLADLSLRERLLGCATCMSIGYVLSFGSFYRIRDLIVKRDPFPFVINATVGNIIALAGSFFMTGPQAQLRKMWQENRRTATSLYLGSLFMTLLVAFTRFPGQGFFLAVLMICQYLSITWYTLSYIPFAHDFITGFVRRRVGGSS